MGVSKADKTIIRKNSTGSDFKKRRLNLIEGTGVTLTVAEDDANNEVDVTINSSGSTDGWIDANEAWTYASSDGQLTYTFYAAGDVTSNYWKGMKIKLVQSSTDKYFLLTLVGSYDSGNDRTPITIFGGQSGVLANATISSPQYSIVKAPQGFSLNPDDWYIEASDTTNRTQSEPVASTWYNLNAALQLDIPPGEWKVDYKVIAGINGESVTFWNATITLSTANNSESDDRFSCFNSGEAASSGNLDIDVLYTIPAIGLELTSETTYYLNMKTTASVGTGGQIRTRNDVVPLRIRAVSAYI